MTMSALSGAAASFFFGNPQVSYVNYLPLDRYTYALSLVHIANYTNTFFVFDFNFALITFYLPSYLSDHLPLCLCICV